MKKWLEKDWFWIGLVLLLSLLAILPLFKSGFYSFHDESHIANLYEMIRGFSTNQFPPRWAPDFSYNFGHPFFIFYYPLPFYLGAAFYFLLNISLFWSLKLVFILSVPLSGLAFYFLMRHFFSRISSFSGAIVYIFTPYRAVDLYVRGAVGELMAFVFMPLVLLSVLKLVEKRTWQRVVFASFSIAGLILAHNLTPIIFLPFVVVFIIFQAVWQKQKTSIVYSILSASWGIIGGLLLSAYYWLPLVFEKQYLQPGTPFNLNDHYPFLKQLLLPSWGYGASVWGPGDGMSFQIGVVNILSVLIAGIIVWVKGKNLKTKNRNNTFLFMGCFFAAIFLMNIRSGFIWTLIPIGNYLQFPWRFLLLTTFFSSLSVGFLEELKLKKKIIFLPIVLAFFSLLLSINYFKPDKETKVDDNYYLRRFFANIDVTGKTDNLSKPYQGYSEDYLPLTIWTKQRPENLPENKVVVSGGGISYENNEKLNYSAMVLANKASIVNYYSYYFPGWKAFVDAKPVEIIPSLPYGNISFQVPPGQHKVEINFVRTPICWISEIVSVSTLLVLLLGIWLKPLIHKK